MTENIVLLKVWNFYWRIQMLIIDFSHIKINFFLKMGEKMGSLIDLSLTKNTVAFVFFRISPDSGYFIV